jgi:ribosomal protein S18 acetylase RimI-like enzyme
MQSDAILGMSGTNNEKKVHLRIYQHPSDYEGAFRIWQSAGKGIHITFSDTIDEIEKLVKRSPGLFFVAEIDGKIVGTVMGGFDGRRGLIYHLAVHPDYQNKHIGTQLLKRVEEALASVGCTKVYLFIVPENINLAGYYKKMDYEQMDVIPFTKYLNQTQSSN